jgi:hypothetical protein
VPRDGDAAGEEADRLENLLDEGYTKVNDLGART